MAHQFTNHLITETSPYLLQHAHNPVNWYAWNKKTLEIAKAQDKLILISVGYAACHWCHVMEHESFEDTQVANIMNAHFINIKVDREERPDIDQVYMNAVQLMTGRGGWPMNVIALPDGRPFWGGTYFKKEQWVNALSQIADLYQKSPNKIYEYAHKLEQGIKAMDMVSLNSEDPTFHSEHLDKIVNKWSTQFDSHMGGMNRAPKFMMPNNYHFLLRYAYQNNNKALLDFVNLTLTKMAHGGVFDHVEGGFSRYAVDTKWHVPHFEKMLYDNGQLVSLYADAYLITKNDLYKNVVTLTLQYVKHNMTAKNGAFYSSLDADSLDAEGILEEGAFYIWEKDTLKTLLKDDFPLFSDYYNINDYGHWEDGKYVLIRKDNEEEILKKHGVNNNELTQKVNSWRILLLEERNKRKKPRLDDKTLTSWNAIMLKGYLDAYRVFGDKEYLDIALKNASFIINTQGREDGALYHNYKNGTSTINGYLEDYATTIDAFIALYENTLNDTWLSTARNLTNYVFDHFFDPTNQMFFFTSNEDTPLVTRHMEYRDNVIPASNSIMAKNLFKLSRYFNNEYFGETAKTMLNNVKPEIQEYASGYSNWMDVMLNYAHPFHEIAIVGKEVFRKLTQLNLYYIPNKLVAGSVSENSLPLLKNRYKSGETLIYVCENNTCKLPVSNTEDAIKLIKP